MVSLYAPHNGIHHSGLPFVAGHGALTEGWRFLPNALLAVYVCSSAVTLTLLKVDPPEGPSG